MLGLRPGCVIAIVKLGISNFINQIITMTVNIVMNNTLAHYGVLYAGPIADTMAFLLSVTTVSLNFKELSRGKK